MNLSGTHIDQQRAGVAANIPKALYNIYSQSWKMDSWQLLSTLDFWQPSSTMLKVPTCLIDTYYKSDISTLDVNGEALLLFGCAHVNISAADPATTQEVLE